MPESPSPSQLFDSSRVVNRGGTSLFSTSPIETSRFFPRSLQCTSEVDDNRLRSSSLTEKEWRRQIEEIQPDVIVSEWTTPPIPSGYCASEDGSIRYVSNATGSIRHIVTREMIEAGLWVTNWGSLVAPMVTEHALTLTLSCLSDQSRWSEVVNGPNSVHKSRLETRTLFKKRVGTHGTGEISRALVKLLRVFDCEIMAYSKVMPENSTSSPNITTAPDLSTLCQDVDILICCDALTPRTQGELDFEALKRLRPGAVFINVGRGTMVDELDLQCVATELELRVGLDVFCEEPLSIDSFFGSIPGTIISPHIAGPTNDAFGAYGDHALENLTRYRSGEEPADLITVAMYDRAS